MKKLWNPKYLPYMVIIASALGLGLRAWLLMTGEDEKGLPVPGHIAEILLWLLTAAVLVVIFLLTRKLTGRTRFGRNFRASTLGAVGTLIGALGIGVDAFFTLAPKPQGIDALCGFGGLIACLILEYLAWCRLKGKKPVASLHVLVSIYMMLHLVSFYRHWSADPILLDYCFQLLASVSVMLAVYQRAAFSAKQGNRKSHGFFSLAGAYFCCLSLIDWQNTVFYLPLAIWMMADLCSMKPGDRQ